MNSQEKLQRAMEYAMIHRPAVGGFPFLAECLRKAGVKRNIWSLPAVQSMYVMEDDEIVNQGIPLLSGVAKIPRFDESALVAALRVDQAGNSTFPEFLVSAWNAGVVGYEVDFSNRKVDYWGVNGERYTESYPAIEIPEFVL